MQIKKSLAGILLFLLLSFSMVCSASESDDIYSKLTTVEYDTDETHVRMENVVVMDGIIYEYEADTDSFRARRFYPGMFSDDVTFPPEIYGKRVTELSQNILSMGKHGTVVLPDSLTKGVFLDNSSVRNLVFPDNMKEPGVVIDGFLRSVKLPANAVKSGKFVFCNNLRSVTMGSKVKIIESFKGCRGLASLKIPIGATTIEANAFKGCVNLELYVPTSVTKIGENAFGSKKSDRIRMLYCAKNSAAYKYAKKNGIPYTLVKMRGKNIELKGIAVPQKTIEMVKTGQMYLNATPVPINASSQKFTYQSSNPEAISVDEYGLLCALKYDASAVITVRSVSNPQIKTKVKVKVRKEKSEKFYLTVNGKTYAVNINHSRKKLQQVQLEQVIGFRIYEASKLKKYGKTEWKLVKQTRKNKLSLKSDKKKYYKLEFNYRNSIDGKTGWELIYQFPKKI